jgi:hypothetical protein
MRLEISGPGFGSLNGKSQSFMGECSKKLQTYRRWHVFPAPPNCRRRPGSPPPAGPGDAAGAAAQKRCVGTDSTYGVDGVSGETDMMDGVVECWRRPPPSSIEAAEPGEGATEYCVDLTSATAGGIGLFRCAAPPPPPGGAPQ